MSNSAIRDHLLDDQRALQLKKYATMQRDDLERDAALFKVDEVLQLIEANAEARRLVDNLAEQDHQARAKRKGVSNLRDHAMRELKMLNDTNPSDENEADAEWSKMIDTAVMELIEVFIEQGHSGGSAYTVLAMFDKLARFESLNPITDDPRDWIEQDENLWQNKRQSSLFSHDGGKTYHDVEKRSWLYKTFGTPIFNLNRLLPKSMQVLYKRGKSKHAELRRTS